MTLPARSPAEAFGPDHCPLCALADLQDRGRICGRRFRECPRCRLLSMHPGDHPSPAAAEARYRLHRNDPADPGYRAFLERLLLPVVRHVSPGARGLDYGSGPWPALAHLARERGFDCDAHDPLFCPGGLAPPYDFVLASEVFEHFRRPAGEITRIAEFLAPDDPSRGKAGGLLAVMTLSWFDGLDLSRWHYLSDPTHLSIYHRESWAWIADRFGLRLEWTDGERVVLLRRASSDRRG